MTPPRGVPTSRLLFRDIARLRARLFDRMLEPHGITSSQSSVIAHLVAEDGLTQSELAARLEIGAVAAGGLVERLETRGLVTRRTDPKDRRANRVHLTDGAHSLLTATADAIAAIDAIAYAGFSAEEVAVMEARLDTIRGNLHAALAASSPRDAAD
ncbi:MarR family winged helix-turn-helix transcriptional regulator [Acuticoccus sp. I52.16.1]|uniref:MarR family winged helix-turn-helix transcriptional regulator n=1 Tax=Acuticoccus sp. I52.16.1 TaxID=2928472 RepID=UPI001FD156D3|nr:MarR family transcriptional regulator [Acuticoccus sp. I52.16.1]UOM33225.1 MarR family transcriptional regulator [Acuticoccus sp. I52.16.1]